MRIAVTTFYSKSYRGLAEITTNVLRQYCNKHGYDLYIHEVEDGNVDFIITRDVRNLLDDYDIVMGIECDILITNLNYKIEDFIDNEHDFFICKDVNNINAGCFIAKSTQYGVHLISFILMNEGRFKTEQNVLEHYQPKANVKYLNHPSINSIPYNEYAPSYGYINWDQYTPRKTKPTLEMGDWQKGNFNCHLPGMTLERRIEIFKKLKEEIIYG